MIHRRKYALLGPLALGVLLILPMWKTVPEKYRATALVKRKDLALTNAAAGSMMIRNNGPVPIETMRAEILTWTNLDRVIKQLRLDVDLKTADDWQDEYEKLKTSIMIRMVAQGRGVDLIEIAVMDKDASSSQKIANAIADNYVEESQRNSRDDTLQAIDYFKTQCDDNLAIIRKMNIELDKYTREHWTELPEVKRGILATLQTLRTSEGAHLLLLSAGPNRLTEIDRQINEVEKTIKSDVQTVDNPARQELQDVLVARNKFLVSLLATHAREDPQVRGVQDEITALEAQLKNTPERVPDGIHETINPLYQTLLQSRMTAEQEIKAEEASLRETQALIMANEASIRKVVDEEKQYDDILRQHDEAKEVYEDYHKSLLALQNLSRVQFEPNGAQVEIIARALEPAEPYDSNRLPLAFACLLGGLIIGLALVTFQERGSFRTVEKAAAFLRVPVLGDIGAFGAIRPRAMLRPEGRGTAHPAPCADGPATEGVPRLAVSDFVRIPGHWGPPSPDLAMVHGPSGCIANEFRHLRAKLLALNGGRPPRVITVSSAVPSLGKTSFALNLAAALGEVEIGRILIVDGDFVQPSLHLAMNVRVQSGLREVLLDGLKLDGRVYETAIHNVDILPSLEIGPDAGFEAPLYQRCKDLLALLRNYYSYVIIDTPPVPAGSLAVTFGRHSDGLILVAELGKTPRYVVAAALNDVAASGVAVLGCVFMAPSSKRKGRLFRTAAIVGGVILLCVLIATLIEGFQPGKLGEFFVCLRQLMD
jgi:Mrp family chromosome partitioning ATPase/uncharacterized protein involved in exopolysaccharide biosynthesis